ncbi:MAG: hypothetical protein K6T83_16415 [Alicyclobacillus sp.]|nr:hypothetical protein [Alicyclobacillus sp.]
MTSTSTSFTTLFPIVSEAISGQRMMVSSPFYNEVNMPLAICILLLMGAGPLLAWRRARMRNLVRNAWLPFCVAFGVGLPVAGLLHAIYHTSSLLGTCGIVAAAFVLFSVCTEFWQALSARRRLTGEPWTISVIRLMARNRRRYGGYIVHAAVAVMAVGIAGSGSYHLDLQQSLRPGQTTTNLAGYTATFTGMGVRAMPGGRVMYADLILARNGHTFGVLQPSASFFANGQQPSTNVALYSTPLQDLYVVMLGTMSGNTVVFDFHVNPLVEFIWFGADLLIIGAAISLWPESSRRLAAFPERDAVVASHYQKLSELTYDVQMGKLDPDVFAAEQARILKEIDLLEASAEQSVSYARLEAEVEAAWRARMNSEGMAT